MDGNISQQNGCQAGERKDLTENGTTTEGTEELKHKRPPRSERKRRYHEEKLQIQREMRKIKKQKNRENKKHSDDIEQPVRGRREKEAIRQKCLAAMETGQIVCIDCSLEQHMSEKEKTKLAMQVGRLYGSNRRADNPAHIYLTGVEKGGQLFAELKRINDGFEKYLIDIEEKTHAELFPLEKLVYLSPDSDNLLTDIDHDKVYVIGGLVDESVKKHVTQDLATSTSVATARLPIVEHMVKLDANSPSQVLAVNQVFDILLNYIHTHDWKTALAVGVPRRKGFVVENDNT